MCLRAKIPDSRETETGSTETRFDVSLVRREAKNSPLARPFGRQIAKAYYAHAVGKPAVDRGLDEIGDEEGEGENCRLPQLVCQILGDCVSKCFVGLHSRAGLPRGARLRSVSDASPLTRGPLAAT
jgi:hypothetical protein